MFSSNKARTERKRLEKSYSLNSESPSASSPSSDKETDKMKLKKLNSDAGTSESKPAQPRKMSACLVLKPSLEYADTETNKPEKKNKRKSSKQPNEAVDVMKSHVLVNGILSNLKQTTSMTCKLAKSVSAEAIPTKNTSKMSVSAVQMEDGILDSVESSAALVYKLSKIAQELDQQEEQTQKVNSTEEHFVDCLSDPVTAGSDVPEATVEGAHASDIQEPLALLENSGDVTVSTASELPTSYSEKAPAEVSSESLTKSEAKEKPLSVTSGVANLRLLPVDTVHTGTPVNSPAPTKTKVLFDTILVQATSTQQTEEQFPLERHDLPSSERYASNETSVSPAIAPSTPAANILSSTEEEKVSPTFAITSICPAVESAEPIPSLAHAKLIPVFSVEEADVGEAHNLDTESDAEDANNVVGPPVEELQSEEHADENQTSTPGTPRYIDSHSDSGMQTPAPSRANSVAYSELLSPLTIPLAPANSLNDLNDSSPASGQLTPNHPISSSNPRSCPVTSTINSVIEHFGNSKLGIWESSVQSSGIVSSAVSVRSIDIVPEAEDEGEELPLSQLAPSLLTKELDLMAWIEETIRESMREQLLEVSLVPVSASENSQLDSPNKPTEIVEPDHRFEGSLSQQEIAVLCEESTQLFDAVCEGLDSPGGSGSSRAASHASPMRNLTSQHGGLYVSAPGKIILFGEHAVVYGRTAIAGSIDLRTYVSLFTSADGRIYLSLPDLGVEKTWMLKDLLRAGERLAAEYPVEEDQPPSLEILVPIARKLSGSCEDQCGVQHLAILAFWYLLLGVAHRKSYDALKAVHLDDDSASDSTSELRRLAKGDAPSRKISLAKDLLAVKCTVRFKLPSCVGLGSSGAYCVCITTALLQTAGIIPPPTVTTDDEASLTWEEKDLDTIRKWATAAESLIHGRASGLDAAVCTYGGVASYKPGTRIEHLKNLPELRVILVNSKVERNTSRMVQTVKERLRKFPDVVEGIFSSIDAISREAAKILHRQENGEEDGASTGKHLTENGGCSENEHHSLQPHRGSSIRSQSLASYVAGGKRGSSASAISATSDKGELIDTFSKLNDLCRINNQLLIGLGVGHPKVDQICTTLARYGIHPKMTGAGGGGSVFAFLKPDTPQTLMDMISSELQKLGYEVWQPPLGGPGVVEHSRRPDLFQTAPSSVASTPASKHK